MYRVALRDDNGNLIGYYKKHEYRNRETMIKKTLLIFLLNIRSVFFIIVSGY